MNAMVLGERDDYMGKTAVPIDRFKSGYLAWLEAYIDLNGAYDNFVADILFSTAFVYALDEDMHRVSDGLELRNQYSDSSGEIIFSADEDKVWPCSVLEVMVSLAMSMEYLCDESPTGGKDDVGYFYHEMLRNLGIGTDFGGSWESKEQLISKVVAKWLDRRYGKNGRGGLFPLKRPRQDQREVELWYQMNAYMIENY